MHDFSSKLSVTTRRFFAGQLSSAALVLAQPLRMFASLAGSPMASYLDPLDFGARGDGVADDTQALQRTIEQAAATGAGGVVLPPGHTFLSSTLVLRPHVELHLAGGSVLRASTKREDYHAYGSLLFAKDSDDIHVSGTGVIDGDFPSFFPPKGPDGYPVPQPFLGPYDPLYAEQNRNPPDGRPRMILLVNCRRVLLQDFTIRDSPTWTVHAVGCEDLHIVGVSIHNDLDVPNCDGIDIDHCRGVRIAGCDIVAGDDCLVLKASRNFGAFGPCENISISNCTLESSSAGIKIETEGPYPLRSAVISNCSIVRSNRGISFLNRDGATVEDLLFQNMTIETRMRPMMWWGSGEAIALSSVPRAAGGAPGLVRGITFADMLCRGESGVYLRGSAQAPLRDISLRGIELAIEKTTTVEGGFYDMRPGDAFGASGLDRRRIAGVFAAEVNGLDLNGMHVSWPGVKPAYFGSAIELHRCSEVSMVDCRGGAANADAPQTVFEDVTFASSMGPVAPASRGR